MAFLGLAVSLAVLIWSGGVLAAVLTRLSRSLHVSSFVVSFVLMAAATTLPEFSVGVISSLEGTGTLAFGAVLGSNIANIALVLGLLLLLNGRLQVKGVVRRREAFWAAVLALVPLLLAADGQVSRIDGAVLLLGFCAYLAQLLRSARFFHKADEVKGDPRFWRDLALFVVFVALLLLSSRWAVHFAVGIAELLGVPVFVIGLFLVAVGTSLPELVFAVRATLAKDPLLSFGDVTGAVVFNASLVLGVAALIRPIVLESLREYEVAAGALFLVLVYLVVAVYTGRMMSRAWGIGLFALYAVFTALEWTRG